MEVIAVLDNIAKYSKDTRSVLRLSLAENVEWFEDDYHIEDLYPEKVCHFLLEYSCSLILLTSAVRLFARIRRSFMQ